MCPISNIDHFFAISPEPEKLFHFLQEDLKLPVVWAFQDYGDFASGGLSLGNVVFEVARFGNPASVSTAVFWGIAFEPYDDAQSVTNWLKEKKIPYSGPQRFPTSGDAIFWENVSLSALMPDNASIFICDYKQREQVRQGRASATQILSQHEGGPLGIKGVDYLVLGSADVKESINSWSSLIGPERVDAEMLRFIEGPDIRIISSEHEGFLAIALSVASLEGAASYLKSHNLIGSEESSSVSIAPAKLQGLHISLVEKG
jgi:hypothetical protein